ncbi:hypothetical protein [Paraeggerthella sp.]|uniref:hypothetical protein n=1 Tax=Paraeggerthella sp. TaxID=2897350 RepID=UPI0035294669
MSVTGDPDNQSNKGLNCVKGYYLAKILYGDDRLTVPLIRDDKSTKGTDDGLREATWDEAPRTGGGQAQGHLEEGQEPPGVLGIGPAAHHGRLRHRPSSGRPACCPTTSTRTRACAWPAPWSAS